MSSSSPSPHASLFHDMLGDEGRFQDGGRSKEYQFQVDTAGEEDYAIIDPTPITYPSGGAAPIPHPKVLCSTIYQKSCCICNDSPDVNANSNVADISDVLLSSLLLLLLLY
ncbi:hypothetical protein NE237_022804 [Protea cynaroides]|uniref:Uncharacterized protein n=1 Tax=Protea cynaroides TaxID=273540 RepID=A0A9Q0HBN3_9MAGN|nr:hypothetical protein NE237_022804 [Protea cynaroides]